MTQSNLAKMPDFCSRRCPVHLYAALMILMKMGVDLRRVRLLADGEHENYKGEVRSQLPEAGEAIGPEDEVVLTVGAYGAFDHLPYQFFYGLDNHGATRSQDWEARARRLMAPFDASKIRSLARCEYEALQFALGFADRDQLSKFLDLFAFDTAELSEGLREDILWSALMPYFHHWAGNAELVTRALECLFGYKFRIIESVSARYDIPEDLQYRLGSQTDCLGAETVLGDSFAECDSKVTVVAEGIRAEDVRRFLPGQHLRRKLDQLLKTCLPGHLAFDVEIRPEQRDGALGAEGDGAYLGYSAFA
jgi:hypothetical protein